MTTTRPKMANLLNKANHFPNLSSTQNLCRGISVKIQYVLLLLILNLRIPLQPLLIDLHVQPSSETANRDNFLSCNRNDQVPPKWTVTHLCKEILRILILLELLDTLLPGTPALHQGLPEQWIFKLCRASVMLNGPLWLILSHAVTFPHFWWEEICHTHAGKVSRAAHSFGTLLVIIQGTHQ